MQPMFALAIDPWILAFSAVTVIATIWMGFWSAKKSKTASDFFVAGRSVSVGWNASAISGEYLSAASFMGVAGMVMSSGYDALWYPVCYACGYLFLLLFIAGPLRRFGAYTIPDFAEGRFDSPLFRKIAVVFVLFIGFFYTMPQMKGAGTTLAYIFPGLPYWAGVVLVGAVITLNVALGGMKGITLVQAFQYWAKMFAISVPIFVLMAVYGHYGKQLGLNGSSQYSRGFQTSTNTPSGESAFRAELTLTDTNLSVQNVLKEVATVAGVKKYTLASTNPTSSTLFTWLTHYGMAAKRPNHTFTIYTPKNFAPLWNAYVISQPEPMTRAELRTHLERSFATNGIRVVWVGLDAVKVFKISESSLYESVPVPGEESEDIVRKALPEKAPADSTWLSPFGPLTTKAAKAAGITGEATKPYSLLYTYSLIIALVCGTAGLPHILVRFYTNPDGVAAKRTTMWVMILIGIFYVFPPVFGVMGRNLLPELYSGVGAKGTDKIVLELPRILNEKGSRGAGEKGREGERAQGGEVSLSPAPPFSPAVTTETKSSGIPWGSIFSGITCAGAFAAFMSTFSGLLVSMTGALAHDVYGRMLRPKSTPEQRLRAFKICTVIIGGIAIVLGCFVEPLEINFMVGQAFAIAAASYFPLLFMSVWWRGMTMKGAAIGMLTGGLCALGAVTLTNVSNLALDKGPMGKVFAGFAPLNDFWSHHPLLRILCEQPAIWTVPLAIGLMIVVGKLTRRNVPSDVRMKMLVLHAPEKLGLKQEYIQEQQQGH
jgi:cation/acetate symporter